MAASLQPSTSPTDTHPTSDEPKQSPPAFLDLADSVCELTCNQLVGCFLTRILQTARLGSNMPELSAVSIRFLFLVCNHLILWPASRA